MSAGGSAYLSFAAGTAIDDAVSMRLEWPGSGVLCRPNRHEQVYYFSYSALIQLTVNSSACTVRLHEARRVCVLP